MKPCGSKPSSPAPWPFWKISRATPKAAPVGEQVGEDAERGDQRRLQRDQEQQEAEREHDADHERRLGGERLLEVVVLGRGAADERPGRQRRAQPVDRAADARARRVGSRRRLHQREAVPARLRRRATRAMPGSRRATAAAALAWRCGATIWSVPGAPGAERLLHLGVADAGAVAARARP